jgi:hypothetical protein
MRRSRILLVAVALSAFALSVPAHAARERLLAPRSLERVDGPRSVSPIPEPAGIALFAVGVGVAGWAFSRRRR